MLASTSSTSSFDPLESVKPPGRQPIPKGPGHPGKLIAIRMTSSSALTIGVSLTSPFPTHQHEDKQQLSEGHSSVAHGCRSQHSLPRDTTTTEWASVEFGPSDLVPFLRKRLLCRLIFADPRRQAVAQVSATPAGLEALLQLFRAVPACPQGKVGHRPPQGLDASDLVPPPPADSCVGSYSQTTGGEPSRKHPQLQHASKLSSSCSEQCRHVHKGRSAIVGRSGPTRAISSPSPGSDSSDGSSSLTTGGKPSREYPQLQQASKLSSKCSEQCRHVHKGRSAMIGRSGSARVISSSSHGSDSSAGSSSLIAGREPSRV
jgi:hypothetical protein